VAGSASLEVFKRCVDTALLEPWFSGRLGSVRLRFGIDDLKGLFQPKRFCDSVICNSQQKYTLTVSPLTVKTVEGN